MSESVPITAPATLQDAQRRALRRVAALMIPASQEHGVPGADDEAIFADIVRSLGRDADAVRAALRRLDELAGGAFADRPDEEQRSAAQRLREGDAALAAVLATVVVRCYYRDDRVMRSLGMEPRPPFPKGFDVEQGDWSLLDPVRARGRIYREVP
jgi:hypothetical protein